MREVQNVLDRVLAAMIPKTGPTKAQMRWFSEDNQHLQPRTELMYYVYDNSSYCWLMLYCHYIIVIIIVILVVVIDNRWRFGVSTPTQYALGCLTVLELGALLSSFLEEALYKCSI